MDYKELEHQAEAARQARNREIYRLRVEEGKTYQEIALQFGLSLPRIQQIVKTEQARVAV